MDSAAGASKLPAKEPAKPSDADGASVFGRPRGLKANRDDPIPERLRCGGHHRIEVAAEPRIVAGDDSVRKVRSHHPAARCKAGLANGHHLNDIRPE